MIYVLLVICLISEVFELIYATILDRAFTFSDKCIALTQKNKESPMDLDVYLSEFKKIYLSIDSLYFLFQILYWIIIISFVFFDNMYSIVGLAIISISLLKTFYKIDRLSFKWYVRSIVDHTMCSGLLIYALIYSI